MSSAQRHTAPDAAGVEHLDERVEPVPVVMFVTDVARALRCSQRHARRQMKNFGAPFMVGKRTAITGEAFIEALRKKARGEPMSRRQVQAAMRARSAEATNAD